MSMTAEINEQKLVLEVQSGSREALGRLLDLCEDNVFNLACRMVGSQDAEDVAQDALVEICNSIGGFRGQSSLSTWIYRVAVNVCLQHRRKRSPDMQPFDEALPEDQPDWSGDPVSLAVKSELKGVVDTAIQSLPDIHRDVVILHEMQGLTYQECAVVLGCPVGTVKSRLSNAFGKLREILGSYESEGGLAT